MKKLFIIISVFIFTQGVAQQLPMTNLYTQNPFLQNPARAGGAPGTNLYALYKHQWDNTPQAPRTGILTADARLFESNHAVGGMLSFDKSNLIQNIQAQLAYSLYVPFNEKKTHYLSLGVQAGMFNQSIDFQQAIINNPNDPTINAGNSNATTYDAGVGLNYHFNGLNIGVACPQILGNTLKFRESNNNSIKYQLERQLFSSLSYRFAIGAEKKFSIEPLVVFRWYENLPWQYDAHLVFDYNQAFWISGGYRTYRYYNTLAEGGLNASIGTRIKNAVSVSYNFESRMNGVVNNYFGYSHEVMIGLRIGKNRKVTSLERRVDSLMQAQHKLKRKLQDNIDLTDSMKIELDSLKDMLNQSMEDIERANNFNKTLENKLNNVLTAQHNVSFKKLGEIFFAKNVFSLDAIAKSQADAVIASLKNRGTNNMIYIVGNASQEGGSNYNLLLSTKRAAFLKKYFIERGIRNNIILTSTGAEDPSTYQDLPKNRRVDIYLAGE
jgi:type IX secretion system PorP/SprF family membrane protein